MIIDKDQLTELLSDKTGLDRERVESQLSELIKRVNKAADEGKSFEIEGFGTFSKKEGELQFTPVEMLETEINNKYAGMKPIELIGAFKRSEGEEIPEMAGASEKREEKVWSFDEDAAQKDAREPASEEELPEEAAEPVYADEKAQEEFETLISGDRETGERCEGESIPPAEERKAASPSQREGEPDPLGKVLVAVVIFLVIGVGGFLVYDMGLLAGNSSGSSSVTTNQSIERSQIASGSKNVTGSATSKDDSEPAQPDGVVTKEESRAPSKEEQQPSYGLKGKVNGAIPNGYTIVVHSLRNREQAKVNRQALEEQGYRAVISRANVQGVTYYRVGLGQFKTVQAAQKAINRIPEQFRSSNFIKRIQ